MSARTASKTGSSARSAGTGRPDCAMRATSVGAGDDELAVVAFELDGYGDNVHSLRFEIPFEQGMAGVVEKEAALGFRLPASGFRCV